MGRFGCGWLIGCAAGLLGVVALGAQTHKVARPESVVRAVGVYEWTGDLAKPTGVRLVPVTIFVDGEVRDAAVYMARPVPLALDQGTLYELDDAGVSRGLVDVKVARHVQIPAAANLTPYDDGWFGYGSFQAPPPPKVLPVKKPTQNVAVNGKAAAVESDGEAAGSKSRRSGTEDADAPAPGSPEDVKVDGGRDAEKDNVDRPTLRRREPVDPKEAKKQRKERDSASVIPGSKSLNDDPDRPTMKRGSNAASEDIAPLNGLPADMRQMIAVSDAKRREAHPFARDWEDEAEHQAVLGKMRAMGMAQLVAYGPVPAGADTISAGATVVSGAPGPGVTGAKGMGANGAGVQDTSAGTPPVLRRNHVAEDAAAKEQVLAAAPPAGSAPAAAARSSNGTSTAKAAPARTTGTRRAGSKARRGAAAKVEPAPVLLDEQVKGYLLSYGGAPVYVYTAHTAGTGAGLRYVTVVAQEDGVNHELKTALHAVTDAAHLDRQPWMRFVDVVDAEASNRASLLFEMRGQTARQFALYRVIGGKADTLFTGGTTQ